MGKKTGCLRRRNVRYLTPKVAQKELIHKKVVSHAKKRKQYNKNYDYLIAHPDDKKMMKRNHAKDDEYTSSTKEHLFDCYIEKYVSHTKPNSDSYWNEIDPEEIHYLWRRRNY